MVVSPKVVGHGVVVEADDRQVLRASAVPTRHSAASTRMARSSDSTSKAVGGSRRLEQLADHVLPVPALGRR